MSYITISFKNGDPECIVERKLFDHYPNSVVSSHLEVFPESNKVTLDTTCTDFNVILDVMSGRVKQWNVPEHIFQTAHRFGLVDDDMCLITDILNNKRNKTLSDIDNFLNSPDTIFIPDLISDYVEYEKIFARRKNIVPFQVVSDAVINIFDGIPIHVFCLTPHKIEMTLEDHRIKRNGVIDVNHIRETMLFSGHSVNDEGGFFDYRKSKKISRNIFDSNELKYLESCMYALCRMLKGERRDFVDSVETKPSERLVDFPASSKMCDKIISIISDNSEIFKSRNEDIKKHSHISKAVTIPEHDRCCAMDYSYHGYVGFINLDITE